MNLLYLGTSILFLGWTIRNILFWANLWQLKEYRFDRVFIHLKETYQGRQLLFSPILLLKICAIFSYGYIVFHSSFLFLYQLIVITFFTVHAGIVGKEIINHQFKRPIITLKSLFIVITSYSIISILIFTPLVEEFVWLLLLDRLTPFLVAFFVFGLSFPTEIYRDIQIEKATKKIKNHRKLLTIGVTGSYGKSSTKEFTAQILNKKFRVLKTSGTNNTPIGIAKTILKNLHNNTEIFVAEMGAYKKGEITQMCSIVKPKISILTAVNLQHVSLFGSLQNTVEAKYEIISELPRNGLALFNGNNKNSSLMYKNPPQLFKEMIKKSPKQEILYRTYYENSDQYIGDIYAYNVVAEKTTIKFDVVLNGISHHFKAPLIGAQNAENILPGIFIAFHLKMNPVSIKKAVSQLYPLTKTMVRHELQNGATVIDDTFNANPQAIIAAIHYMKLYKNTKILVMQPMIELGKNANDEHYEIAREIAKTCNFLFVTNKNFYDSIQKGIKDSGAQCFLSVAKPLEIADFINKRTRKGDVIIFEGKEAGFALQNIL